MRKPFYWKSRRGWYIKNANRRNVFLADDEEDAHTAWAEMVAAGKPEGPEAIVAAVINEYLTALERTVAPSTYKWRGYYLAAFATAHGLDRVRDLKPLHVTKWLAGRETWGPDSQRAAIAAIKACLNWALDQGMIDQNPLVRVKKPAGGRREKLVTQAEHSAMAAWQSPARGGKLGSYPKRDGAFRAVLIALYHSGVRPGTICAVRVENVAADLSTWTVPEHKTRKKTGRPLVIYLSPCLASLTRLLAAGRTAGPLFRDSRGKAWTPNAIRCRMRRLRVALDLSTGTVAYSYRHTFATKAIVAGNDVATVAELLGHGDVAMIQKFYGHLTGQSDHLKRAAAKAMKREAI